MRLAKFLIGFLFVVYLAGCGNKEIETASKEVEKLHNKVEIANEREVISEYQPVNEQDTMNAQEVIASQDDSIEEMEDENIGQDVIQEYSQIQIKNFLQDGTFWGIETDEMGEVYTIHADVHGNVMKRLSTGSMGKEIRYGVGDRFVIWEQEYPIRIYDLDINIDVTNDFIGDYDEIYDLLETEDGLVFVITKTIDTFEEKYMCVKLLDADGNTLSEISLDKNTLLTEHGIERNPNRELNVKWAGEKVFYIPYVGDEFADQECDSLIIDVGRNKIISIDAPMNNTTGYCHSDGNYTVIYESHRTPIIVNNETGEVTPLGDESGWSEYLPASAVYLNIEAKSVSEGKFLATSSKKSEQYYVLDVQGNVIMDLNNYAQKLAKFFPFAEGVALIEFENGYVTFIDSNGEFLFEPVKGDASYFFDDLCAAVVTDYDMGEMFLLDKAGNKEKLYMTHPKNIFYAEYQGKAYLIEGEGIGLNVMEIK